jgi:MoxR-like ATPase
MKFLNQIIGIAQRNNNKDIFHEIVGYAEVKKAFQLFEASEESSNALLDGPPGCSKTLFLLALKNKHDNAFWVDGGNASGAGMLDEMLDRKTTTHLLIDEIDGLKTNDQKAILNLLDTGILSSVKVRNKKETGKQERRKEFKGLKVYATCNDMTRLSKALRSRFFRITLKEYSEREFIEIATKLYPKKDPELVQYVARATWKVLESKDIRDFQKIMKNSKDSEDADILISLQLKYKAREEES